MTVSVVRLAHPRVLTGRLSTKRSNGELVWLISWKMARLTVPAINQHTAAVAQRREQAHQSHGRACAIESVAVSISRAIFTHE